jgi:hypothetical protein
VPSSSALYRDQRFRQQYFVSGVVALEDGKFGWCIWERKDAPGANPSQRPMIQRSPKEQRQRRPKPSPKR